MEDHMRLRLLSLAASLVLMGGQVAWADIIVTDAYLRTATPMAKSGAVFLHIENTGTEDDRLIGAETAVSRRSELHTHIKNAEGVMQMREVEGGMEVPAGGTHVLERGADHVMLMGLTEPLEQGRMVDVILIFENAGRVTVSVPVDRER